MNLRSNHTIFDNNSNQSEGFPIGLIPTILGALFCIACLYNVKCNDKDSESEIIEQNLKTVHPTLALTQKFNPLMSTNEIVINANNNHINKDNNNLHNRNEKDFYENDLRCYNMI